MAVGVVLLDKVVDTLDQLSHAFEGAAANGLVGDQAEESLAYDFSWSDDDMDARFLERGLVYLDKESAIARAKAMLITQEVK